MSLMTSYKLGQGRQARNLAAILVMAIVAWGCYAFFEYGNSKLDRLLGTLFSYDKAVLSAPLAGEAGSLTSFMTPSLLIALGLFVLAFFWARGYLNRPKVADHLIGTELEMRRVKWPTKKEVVRASSMVVYYVVWMAIIIFVIDLIMASTINRLLGAPFESTGIGRIWTGLSNFFGGTGA